MTISVTFFTGNGQCCAQNAQKVSNFSAIFFSMKCSVHACLRGKMTKMARMANYFWKKINSSFEKFKHKIIFFEKSIDILVILAILSLEPASVKGFVRTYFSKNLDTFLDTLAI